MVHAISCRMYVCAPGARQTAVRSRALIKQPNIQVTMQAFHCPVWLTNHHSMHCRAGMHASYSRSISLHVTATATEDVHSAKFNFIAHRNMRSRKTDSWQKHTPSKLLPSPAPFRGTTFGLKTGGRIESILMSLPLTARWMYDNVPAEGTPEHDLIDACKNPRTWV